MKAKRRLLFQILAVVLLVAIGYTMTIIGRGHTIYLDSKTLEYDGQTYKPAYKTVVYVDGQQVAKLYDKERGIATCIGQTLTVTLEITQQKGGTEEVYAYNIPVPRKMDNVIINLPGFLAGLPEEAYLSEFIPSPDEVAADETDVPSDDDFGSFFAYFKRFYALFISRVLYFFVSFADLPDRNFRSVDLFAVVPVESEKTGAESRSRTANGVKRRVFRHFAVFFNVFID